MMRMGGMNMEWGCSQEGEGGRQIKMMTCGHHRVETVCIYMCINGTQSKQGINMSQTVFF